MAEEDAPAAAVKHGGSFFTQKAGPLPVWGWAVIAAGIWWYFNKQKAGAAGATGAQTDPAGNVGTIDPATGYVYGTPQDTAGLSANQQGSSGATTTDATSGSTVAGKYATNAAWAQAAINYLVGVGIDPSSANEAIQQFLASQQLTAQQQGDVNTAISALGAPPDLPGPIGTPPVPIVTPPDGHTSGPVTTPPAGTVYAANPPSGVAIGTKTATTIGLKWNKSANATGYTVQIFDGTKAEGSTTAPGTQGGITIGALKPFTHYNFRVQATPAKAGAPFATTNATTNKK